MQHTLKTESGEYLVVDVPETLYKSYIYSVGASKYLCAYYQSNENWKYKDFYLPPGNWEIIGLYPGITEEQMAGIVEGFEGYAYADYMRYENGLYYYTALESFASLLEANRIYTVNPLGKDPRVFYHGEQNEGPEVLMEWQEAEDRTSKFKLILKKL